MEHGFSAYHPAVNFLFFTGAIGLGMFFIHPLFLCAAFVLSATCYLSITGRKAWKRIGALSAVMVAVAAINPLFVTQGNTVLFTYLGGRAYTLEALCYGAAAGAMFFSVMLWFGCWSAVMTSDKLMYMLGGLAPSATLLFSMTLRFVPDFGRKIRAAACACKGVGKDTGGGNARRKTQNALEILSGMTGRALEDAVITSDSMQCRGYGLKGRTTFRLFRLYPRDRLLLIFIPVLMAAVLVCAARGAAAARYLPAVEIPKMTVYSYAGMAAYVLFLMIPSIMTMAEDIQWRFLRSRI